MKLNQKGQALIEFIILLPVVIMLIFSFIDLGRIILENNRLEGLTTIVISKYEETDTYDDVNEYIKSLGYENVNLSLMIDNDLLTVEITKKIDIITPGLNKIIGNPYTVKVERTIRYE